MREPLDESGTAPVAPDGARDGRATVGGSGGRRGRRRHGEAPTRVSTLWAALVAGLVFLIVVLVFIFQNLQDVSLSFFAFHGRLPLAVALVCAALLGALVVTALGTVRILQLRAAAKRHRRAAEAATSAP